MIANADIYLHEIDSNLIANLQKNKIAYALTFFSKRSDKERGKNHILS